MKRSITRSVIAIVMLLSTVSFGNPNLSGEYWFGSLSVDVDTHAPLGKRGTVSISGDHWYQEWDDANDHYEFSSDFTTAAQPDGSIDVNFTVGGTYNVAWNGDVMIHAGSVLLGGGEGIDIFTRKATNVDVNDVLGDHGFFGHWLGRGDDSDGWGNMTFDPNGTIIATWTNDRGVIESDTFDWTVDDANAMIDVLVPMGNVLGHVKLLLGKGGIASECHILFEEGRDGSDLGYAILIKKTDQMITMADIAGTYQIRFLETGLGAVPYTCGQGTCVIEAVDDANGILSRDAYYSNEEHEISSIDCSVGPGNQFHLDDDSVPDGIISPDKNLIFIPEYRYKNPPERTDDDWLGGIFLVRTPDCRYLLDGDLNKDCRVDFRDFSILAHKWLVDCDEAPLDPACRCDIPWVAEAPMNVARDQFAGGVIDGRIYVFGGNGNPNGINLKSTERYNPATMRWSRVANNENNDSWGVEELTSAVVNDKLYVFGAYGGIGPGGDYGVFNFNEMYDPETDLWTTLAEKTTTVASAPATVYNNEIYIFGGYFDSDNPSQGHDDYDVVECYDPNTNTWRFVTNMPQVITNFGLATIDNKAYIFGGYVPGAESFRDEVIAYDFQEETWTTGYQPTPVKKAYMYSVSAPVIDGKVYLIGGGELIEGEYVYDRRVDIYNPVTDTWEEGTPLPLPLGDHVTLAIGGRIYVLGGDHDEDFENRAKAEVMSLDTEFCNN